MSNIVFHQNKEGSNCKDFRVCDILDFTYAKEKKMPNLYLIREICINLDFSGNYNKIEKEDETLPDIEIFFKIHPIIQKMHLSQFPEAKVALDIIQKKIDDTFALD